jgi:hypothetical protein
MLPNSYPILLKDIKEQIQHAQVRAALSANRELIILYWEIGRLIAKRQQKEGWGAISCSGMGKSATTCCTITMGTQYFAHSKGQRYQQAPLVHESNH